MGFLSFVTLTIAVRGWIYFIRYCVCMCGDGANDCKVRILIELLLYITCLVMGKECNHGDMYIYIHTFGL